MFDLTEEEIAAMASVDVRTMNIDTLTDIWDIKIDAKQSVEKS